MEKTSKNVLKVGNLGKFSKIMKKSGKNQGKITEN